MSTRTFLLILENGGEYDDYRDEVVGVYPTKKAALKAFEDNTYDTTQTHCRIFLTIQKWSNDRWLASYDSGGYETGSRA